MPPVAEEQTWAEAIDAALADNRAHGTRPQSARQLWKRLAAMSGGSPTEASWKRTINRTQAENYATERNAKLIAEALGVARSSLPTAGRVTTRQLDRRLAEVEDGLRELGKKLHELSAAEMQSAGRAPQARPRTRGGDRKDRPA